MGLGNNEQELPVQQKNEEKDEENVYIRMDSGIEETKRCISTLDSSISLDLTEFSDTDTYISTDQVNSLKSAADLGTRKEKIKQSTRQEEIRGGLEEEEDSALMEERESNGKFPLTRCSRNERIQCLLVIFAVIVGAAVFGFLYVCKFLYDKYYYTFNDYSYK